MQHLDEGTVHAWLDGELSADDAQRAARHAAECAECGALVAEARGVLAGASRIVSALDAGPAGVVPATQRTAQAKRRSWYRFALTPARMSIAATLLVAAGVTLTFQRSRFTSDGTPPSRMIGGPVPASVSSPGITDSIATVAGAARAETTSPPAAPVAQKIQNKPVVAFKTDAGPTAAVGGTPIGDKKTVAELKARDADADAAKAASVVAQAPAAAPAPAPAVARLDSVRAKDEARAALAGDRAVQSFARRQPASANQLSEAVRTNERETASMSGSSFQDCYRLDIDSTPWRGALPATFALAPAVSANSGGGAAGVGGAVATRQAAAGATTMKALLVTPLNVVHGVTAIGRVDSTVLGDWRQASPSVVTVRFNAAAQRKQVRLLLAANSPMAQVYSTDGIDSVHVARMNCVR